MSNIKNDVEEIAGLKDKLKAFIHGGDSETVDTDSGTWPSIAKAIKDAVITPNNDTDANKIAAEAAETGAAASLSGANVAKDTAITNADRAEAAQTAMTDAATRAETAAALAETAKDLAVSTSIGDEDYVIPAVATLLNTYTDVVATAVSDDVWAEHSYKWGAPTKILAIAVADSIVLHDLTKPSLPVWQMINKPNNSQFNWPEANVIGEEKYPIRDIVFSSASLVVGTTREAGEYPSGGYGLFILDFSINEVSAFSKDYRYKYNGGIDSSSAEGFSESSAGGLVSGRVNAIAAYIPDNAPHHPISGLPMPTIAVATEGGVSELTPNNDGGWSVDDWPSSGPIFSVDYKQERLLAKRELDGRVYDLSTLAIGTLLASTAAAYKSSIGSVRTLSGGHQIIGNSIESDDGMSVIKENPSDKDAGMIAHVMQDYSTPYMVGDVQTAIMCDGEEGVISGGDLVNNGDFSSSGIGNCTIINSCEIANVSNQLVISENGSSWGVAGWEDLGAEGDVVLVEADVISTTGTVRALDVSNNQNYTLSAGQRFSQTIKLGSDDKSFGFGGNGSAVFEVILDNISVKLATQDRSGRNNHAIINGTLTRAKPAGSDIAVWSGIENANYLSHNIDWNSILQNDEQWAVSFTVKPYSSTSVKTLLEIGSPGGGEVNFIRLHLNGSGFPAVWTKSTSGGTETSTMKVVDQVAAITFAYYGARRFKLFMYGVELLDYVISENSFPVFSDDVEMFLGRSPSVVAPQAGIEYSQLTVSNTIPSADQVRELHRDMLNKLKSPSMLTGNVKALAHDSDRNQDWIACDDGQIHRLDGTCISESIAVDAGVGTIAALTVDGGEIIVSGSTGVSVAVPEKNLRAVTAKRPESVRTVNLGEGDSTTTDFYLARGWKPQRAIVDGIRKREGSQDDWTAQFDGYRWFIRFATAPGIVDIDADAIEVSL
ncbi:MAG: hypothetical protein MJK10_03780 [Pseudomonadales bacterium]|nr:hypothetical protein [Pseudomonadales bacterium]NRA15191.1 hypothetical protein [Oceanospirillaceae bacterium]